MKNLKKKLLTILALIFAPAVLANEEARESYILEKGCYHINLKGNFLQFCTRERAELFSLKEGDIIPHGSIENIEGVWKSQATTYTNCQSVEVTKDSIKSE